MYPLAAIVLSWGKKAPVPAPEPSTLGMTLLAVCVCWLLPLVLKAISRCFSGEASGQRSRAAQQADGLVVVGGGLAGLAAAAALTRVAGVQRVSVLERSSAAAFGDEEAGAAAQLGPNGLRALRFIGGDETLAAVRSAGTDLAGTAIHPAGGAAVMLIPDPAKADTGLPQVLNTRTPTPTHTPNLTLTLTLSNVPQP